MEMGVQGLKEFRGTCPPISSQIKVEWWGHTASDHLGAQVLQWICRGHKASNKSSKRDCMWVRHKGSEYLGAQVLQ